MSDVIRVSAVRFVAASASDIRSGLLGWIALTLNNSLRLDGLTLRRTRDGRLALSFPERRDLAGGSHHYMRPLNDAARRAIEAQVFAALGLEGNVGP